jgi:hypothetical protein
MVAAVNLTISMPTHSARGYCAGLSRVFTRSGAEGKKMERPPLTLDVSNPTDKRIKTVFSLGSTNEAVSLQQEITAMMQRNDLLDGLDISISPVLE